MVDPFISLRKDSVWILCRLVSHVNSNRRIKRSRPKPFHISRSSINAKLSLHVSIFGVSGATTMQSFSKQNHEESNHQKSLRNLSVFSQSDVDTLQFQALQNGIEGAGQSNTNRRERVKVNKRSGVIILTIFTEHGGEL